MLLKTLTLGCKVNQYETEYLRAAFRSLGYEDAPAETPADLILVNTCTVTAQSDFKSRKLIRKLAKENPGAEIVVFGCYAANNPEEAAGISGVTEIITDKREIPAFLKRRGLVVIPGGIEQFGERHRAFIKVQDGCKVGCSYCIIPKVRPYLLSRPISEILPEVEKLAENGYREIVLTGIHLGHYGVDLPQKPRLSELVCRIIDLPDKSFRLRISSLEAVEVDDKLIDLMAAHPDRISPHLHLSMQSGADAVLANMRRRWPSGPFIECCERILAMFDRMALTTDVIVGFPGETERQFEETCEVVERLRFSKVHVFRFSPRKGTIAAGLPDRVPPDIQKRRAEHLQKISDRIRAEYARSLVGMRLQVLFEKVDAKYPGRLIGTADRYLECRAELPPENIGRLVPFEVSRAEGEILFGKSSIEGNDSL